MQTKYDKLTVTHNLSGVVLPTDRYEHIYVKGAYIIPLFVALYDDSISKGATRMEVHKAVGKQEAKYNDRTLYKMADTACKKFIMEVVNKMWYKEIEEPAMFYTNAPALNSLTTLTSFVWISIPSMPSTFHNS